MRGSMTFGFRLHKTRSDIRKRLWESRKKWLYFTILQKWQLKQFCFHSFPVKTAFLYQVCSLLTFCREAFSGRLISVIPQRCYGESYILFLSLYIYVCVCACVVDLERQSVLRKVEVNNYLLLSTERQIVFLVFLSGLTTTGNHVFRISRPHDTVGETSGYSRRGVSHNRTRFLQGNYKEFNNGHRGATIIFWFCCKCRVFCSLLLSLQKTKTGHCKFYIIKHFSSLIIL